MLCYYYYLLLLLVVVVVIVLFITVVLYSALLDCLLRSAPSPASVKQNGLEGRE